VKSRELSADRVAEARRHLAVALGALPELDRQVLSLRLLDGLTLLEAAGALRLTTREVERRTESAMRVLSRELGIRRAARRVA
jgi:DNA-directed RNA polymerase specialized sigma24 family protein